MSTRVTPELTPEQAFDFAVLAVEAHVNAAHEGQSYPWLCHECRRYEAAEQAAAHAYGLAIDPMQTRVTGGQLMTPKSIWLLAQNRPTLIAADLRDRFGVPMDATYGVLLARGVFKWFSVRRDLIRLKNKWKAEETHLQAQIAVFKGRLTANRADHEARRDLAYTRGRLAELQACRAEIRALCHSERWQAPDNDKRAAEWLRQQQPSAPV